MKLLSLLAQIAEKIKLYKIRQALPLIVGGVISVLLAGGAYAVDIDRQVTHLVLEGKQISYVAAQKYSFEEIILDQNIPWQRKESSNPLSLGLAKPAYWFKLELSNRDSIPLDRLLEIAYPVLDEIEIYFVVDGKLVREERLGDTIPFEQRLYEHRNFIIPIEFSPQQKLTLYLRVQTQGALQLPIMLWQEREFLISDQKKVLWQGSFYGTLLIMVLYNLFIFISIRERSYFLYVVFVALSLFAQAALHGDAFHYLWPDSPWWNNKAFPVLGLAMIITGYAFVNEFLGLSEKFPRFYQFLNLLIVFSAGILLASFFVANDTILRIASVVVFPVIIIGIYVSVSLSLRGERTAQFFTLAWMSFFVGVIIFVLNKLGVVPRTFVTERGVQIGTVLDVLLLSFALGDRINRAGKERITAQQNMIVSEKKALDAQEQALAVEKRAKEELEHRVQERTYELEVAMAELEALNQKLQDMNTIDALTGVKNRGFFETKWESEWKRAQRDQAYLAVLMIDVDYFKKINDSHGHLAGDHCLRQIAACIQKSVRRPVDKVARYGGEEFAVVLPGTDYGGARFVAENIRLEVELLRIRFENQHIPLTASIGIGVCVPQNNIDEKYLIRIADEALYRAKQGGRNKVVMGNCV